MTSPSSLPDASANPETFADLLRRETSAHHRRAEQSEFQKSLISGRADRDAYIGWLGQMLLVYQALETALTPNSADPDGPIRSATWHRSEHLRADLASLGVAPESVTPLPPTTEFIANLGRWAAEGRALLIGPLYVLEGSSNGGTYIAKSLGRALELGASGATRFLDPYGADQAARWQDFRTDISATVDERRSEGVVATAQATFDAITKIGQAILDSRRPR